MQHVGISLSIVTYSCYLRSCDTEGSISYGQEVHMEVGKKGFEKESSYRKHLDWYVC